MLKSLSIRLLLIFVIGFVLLIALLRLGVGHSIKQEINSLQAGSVMQLTRIIMGREQNINWARAERIAERAQMDIQIQAPERFWSSSDVVLDADSLTFSAVDTSKIHHSPRRPKPMVDLAKNLGKKTYRVTLPTATFYFTIDRHQGRFGWHFLLIAALFLFGLYIAIRYLFAPVNNIKRVVKEIGDGNFQARTNVHRHDELGELAKQVDDMSNKISNLMESKRSLLLGISHELRTPITRAKVSTELLSDSKHRQSIVEDMQEMDEIISELIEAEKLSENASLSRQAVSINALVVELLQSSFSEEGIRFHPLPEEPYLNIDPIRVKLLLKNLLKNALQYTPQDRERPLIQLALNTQELIINVEDFGVGVEKDKLSRLTEPFYRPDPSRQRATGGFGLGLYLCNVIARAHNGNLTITSELKKGTVVTVLLSLV